MYPTPPIPGTIKLSCFLNASTFDLQNYPFIETRQSLINRQNYLLAVLQKTRKPMSISFCVRFPMNIVLIFKCWKAIFYVQTLILFFQNTITLPA